MTITPNPSQVDRLDGVNEGIAAKAPVRLATTANITLSGEQTIDGVAAVELDRVLVKDQTDLTLNGIYDASTGTWRRALDCNGNRDLVKGSRVWVTEGSTQARTEWACISGDPDVEFDTDEIEFVEVTGGGGGDGFPNASYVTVNDESSDLPNSRQIAAGVGISLTDGGAGNPIVIATTVNYRSSGIYYQIDGQGSAITTGIKALAIRVPFNCVITGVTLGADQSGSAVLDIWKDVYANYPPTGADSICASAKPTISATDKYIDTTLTGWSTTLLAGDQLRLNVDSCSTITKLDFNLHIQATS
jgi:hypothetical protein